MVKTKKVTTSYGEVEIPTYDYPILFPEDMKYDHGYMKDFSLLQNQQYANYMPFRYKDKNGVYNAAYISPEYYTSLTSGLRGNNENEYINQIRQTLSEAMVNYTENSELPVVKGTYEDPYLSRTSVRIPDVLMLRNAAVEFNGEKPIEGTMSNWLNMRPKLEPNSMDVLINYPNQRTHRVDAVDSQVTPELLDAMTYVYGQAWAEKNKTKTNGSTEELFLSSSYDLDDSLSYAVGKLLADKKVKDNPELDTSSGIGKYQKEVIIQDYKKEIGNKLTTSNFPTLSGDVFLAYFDGVGALSPRAKDEFYEKYNLRKDAPVEVVNIFLKKAIVEDLCHIMGHDYQQAWDTYLKYLNPENANEKQIDTYDQIFESLITEYFTFAPKDIGTHQKVVTNLHSKDIYSPQEIETKITTQRVSDREIQYQKYRKKYDVDGAEQRSRDREEKLKLQGDMQYYAPKLPMSPQEIKDHNIPAFVYSGDISPILFTEHGKEKYAYVDKHAREINQKAWESETYISADEEKDKILAEDRRIAQQFYDDSYSEEQQYIRNTDPAEQEIINYHYQKDNQLLTSGLSEQFESANSLEDLDDLKSDIQKAQHTLDIDYLADTKKLYKQIKDSKFKRIQLTYDQMTPEEKQAFGENFEKDYMTAIPIFNQYIGTDKITFSNAQYQEMGLEFQRKLIYEGQEAAFAYLQSTVKNHVANNMGVWETIGRTCLDWWDTFATDVLYLPGMLAGYVDQSIREGSWELSNFVDNEAVSYLNNVVTTGSWSPTEQQEHLQNGTHTHAVWTDEQDEDFLSWKTAATLGVQTAHIAGFSVGSSGVSKLAKPIIKQTTKYSVKVGNMGKVWTQGASKMTMQQLDDVVARAAQAGKFDKIAAKGGAWAGIVGQTIAESTMEAANVCQTIKSNAENEITNITNEAYVEHIEAQLQEDPQQFAVLYTHMTGNQLPDMKTNYYQNLQTLRSFMYNNEQYKQQYLNSHTDLQQEIERRRNAGHTAASDAAAVTWVLDAILGSVTNGIFQKGILSRDMQQALEGSPAEFIKITSDGADNWLATSTRSKFTPIKTNALEVGSQFYEEWQQGINSNIGLELGQQFYDDKVIKGAATDFVDALSVAFSAAGESAISKETLYEGLIGMFSSLIGIPTIKSNRNTQPRGANESIFSYLHRKNPIGWRSPAVDAFGKSDDYKATVQREQEILDFVNSYFSDPKHQQLLFDGVRRIQVLKDLTEAKQSGDPKAIKDAQNNVVYESAAFVVSLKGSEYYDAVVKILEDQSALSITNLEDQNSLESQLVLQYLQIPENKGATEEEALAQIQNSSSQILGMIEKTDKVYEEVKKALQSDDPQLIFYTVKKKVLLNEKIEQREKLKERIRQYKEQLPEGVKSKLSDDNIDFLLEYGTIQNAEKVLSKAKVKTQTEIDELKSKLKGASPQQKRLLQGEIQLLENEIIKLEQNISKNREEIEAIPENERNFGLRDILNFKGRASLINGRISSDAANNNLNTKAALENTKMGLPSEEQLQEFKSAPVINSEADLTQLPDHIKSTINQIAAYDADIAKDEEELVQLFTRPQQAIDSFRQAQHDTAVRISRYKFAELEDPNLSYEDFFSKFYKYYNSETTTPKEKAVMLETVENSPHKKRLDEELSSHNQFMQFFAKQGAFKDLSENEQANIYAALDYLFQNRIPLDETANIDDIFNALDHISAEDFLAQLQKGEVFEGQYKVIDKSKVASSIKSVFDSMNTKKQEIAERMKEHENIEAAQPVESAESNKDNDSARAKSASISEEMDNAIEKNREANQQIVDDLSVNQNEQPEPQSKEQETGSTNTIQEEKADKSFFGAYDRHKQQSPQSHSKITDDFFASLQERVAQERQRNANLTDEDIDDMVQTAIAGISTQAKKAAVKQIYNEIQNSRNETGTSNTSSNQSVTLASEDPIEQKYLDDHKNKYTLGNAKLANGTEFYFYSPKELAGTSRPVAVLIKDERGDIELKGQKYSVVGTTTKSEAMALENANDDPDFLYSQKGKATYVSKEAYDRGVHPTTNVREITSKENEPSSSDIAKGTTLKTDRVSKRKTKYSQYVYNLHRGRGGEVLEIPMYVTDVSSVKDKEGKTLFDRLKDFIGIPHSSAEERADAADKVSSFNYRVSHGVRILKDGLNEIIDLLLEEGVLRGKELHPEDYNKQLNNLYEAFIDYLMLAGHKTYTFTISDITVEGETFSFTLNLSDGEATVPLTRISNVNKRQRASFSDAVSALYHLSHDSEGNVRKIKEEKEEGDEGSNEEREVSFLKWNVHYFQNPKIEALTADIDAGMYEINHATFNYPATDIRYAFVAEQVAKEESPQTQTIEEKATDNATPTKGISEVATTIEGNAVNEDTGYSPESSNESLPSSEEESTDDEVPYMILDENSIVDDDELQIIENRKSIIASIKEKISRLIFDNNAKHDYNDWVETAKQEYQQDTRPNAFSQNRKHTLKDARKAAEKRAKEILATKDPRIKNIRIVRSSPIGYSLQIEYNSYDKYAASEMSKLHSLDTGTLIGLNDRLQETSSIVKATQKQAEERLTLFTRFKKGTLYKAYKKLMGTKVDSQMETIVKQLLQAYNFKVVEKALDKVHGKDVAGKLDTLGKIVYLAQSANRTKLTSVEELAHVIVDTILEGNTKEAKQLKELLNSLMEEIETTEFYKSTAKEYSKIENYDLKKEAVGKALATVIALRHNKTNSFIDKVALFLTDVVTWFASLLQQAGLSKGTDAILQHKLNTIAKKLVDNKVSALENSPMDNALIANNLSTTKKYKESEKVKQAKERLQEVKKTSSAVSIQYKLLSSQIQKLLSLKKISQQLWESLPFGLQDNILQCLTKM